MQKKITALAPMLSQIVEAARAHDDLPEAHARALTDLLVFAIRQVPARGIFDPGSRSEPEFFDGIDKIGRRHLGFAAAEAALRKAVDATRLPFKQRDAIATSLLELRDASDTTYYYAGLAFGLTLAYYGAMLQSARTTKGA